MLDENEYEIIHQMSSQALTVAKENRRKNNLPIENLKIEEIFQSICEKYQEMTGFKETNHIAILHHRISFYGEPCENCGKPLRTPQANFCAACGKIYSKPF